MLKEKIINEINNRQYHITYNDTKFIVFDIEYGGFGAMYARRKLALQFGEYFKRTVILRYTDYAYEDPFINICKYTINDILTEKLENFNYDINQNDKVVYFNFMNYWLNNNIKKQYHEKSINNLNFIMFSGLLLNFIKLNEKYKSYLEEKKKQLCLGDNIIGVHIRRGDKERESPFIPIERYIKELEIIKEKTGFKKIYVCSDSNKAINEIKSKLQGFEIHVDEDEKRLDNKEKSNLDIVLLHPELKEIETFNSIKNIYLLSGCNYILGQSNVQFPKIALCKMADKTNELKNYTLINPHTLKNVEWDWAI